MGYVGSLVIACPYNTTYVSATPPSSSVSYIYIAIEVFIYEIYMLLTLKIISLMRTWHI